MSSMERMLAEQAVRSGDSEPRRYTGGFAPVSDFT